MLNLFCVPSKKKNLVASLITPWKMGNRTNRSFKVRIIVILALDLKLVLVFFEFVAVFNPND